MCDASNGMSQGISTLNHDGCFSGVFSGSAFAGHVTNPYKSSKPADIDDFLVAIKPDLIISVDDFNNWMDYLYQRVVGCEKMESVDRIYYPGEIEQIMRDC